MISSSSAVAASTSSCGAGLDDVGAGEDVIVVEQIGLVGQDLLDPERPLLVPGSGQAEGLVPGRELDGAGPGVTGEGDAEHLQHDALHVVLGLGLGQAERVDLHPVAETASLRIGDPVALLRESIPQVVKARILQVSSTKRMPALTKNDIDATTAGNRSSATWPDARTASSTATAVAEGVGDLLDRRRPGLLQVIGADVHRVPIGNVLGAEGDDVDGQPAARAREGRCRCPGSDTP